MEKLLEVPMLPVGTGEAATSAVYVALEKWGKRDQVEVMYFDTTQSNIGICNGACMMLEQKTGQLLLSVACCYHVLELVIEKAISVCMGPSSGSDITIFSQFKEHWPVFNQTAS